MASYNYSNYGWNLNKRSIVLNESRYDNRVVDLKKIIKTSEDKNAVSCSRLILKSLEVQYDDYTKTKSLPKAENQGKRRLEFGELLQDKHGMLISQGLSETSYNYTYKVDLTNCLDILISATFGSDLTRTRKELSALCASKNISTEYLSMLVLLNDIDFDLTENNDESEYPFTISDLCNCSSELNSFVQDIVKQSFYNSISPLSLISQTDYSAIFDVEDSEEIATAIMLKLLTGGNEVLRWLVVELYKRMGQRNNFLIVSQYLCGLVFDTESLINDDFIYENTKIKIKLPITRIR